MILRRFFVFLQITVGIALAATSCGPESSGPPAGKTDPVALPPVELPGDPGQVQDLYAHSLAVAEEVRRKLPGRAQPLFDLGNVQRRFGFDEKAVETFREGLQLDRRQPVIYESIGFLLSQKNQMEKAIEAYQLAIQLDPKRSGPRTRIGLIYAHEGKLDESAGAYNDEIKNGTASADTYFNLGQALLLKKDSTAARQAFKQCIQLHEKHENAWYGLFQAERGLEHAKEAEEAMAQFKAIKEDAKKLYETSPKKKSNREQQLGFTAETYLDASQTYLAAGMRPDVIRCLRGAILFDPQHDGAHYQLAEMLREDGDKKAARDLCEKTLKVNPDHARALFLLAGLCTEDQQYSKSAELLQKLIHVKPDDADANREFARLGLYGRIPAGNPLELARQHGERAVELQRTAQNLEVLSGIYYRLGQKEKAIAMLEEAVQLDPGNAALRQRLAGVTQK